MRYLFTCIIILLVLIQEEAYAELFPDQLNRNVVFLEAGGIGGYGSINYERIFPIKNILSIGARVGLSTYNLKDFTNTFNPDIILPLGFSLLYGFNHKLELGIGNTVSNIVETNLSNWKPERVSDFHANFTIGYRFQRESGKVNFRCFFSPIIESYRSIRLWGGVSIGLLF